MNISRRTDYAIRMLMEVGRRDGEPVSVRELAESQGVPYAFARSIQRDLVAAGFAESRRGAAGGLMLARPASTITLLDVVEAMQGPISCSVCTRDPDWCSRMGGCGIHSVWRGADELVRRYLGTRDLEGLLLEERGEVGRWT